MLSNHLYKPKPEHVFMSDEALMESVLNGDLDKVAVLYERYKKPVLNFFIRFGADRESGRDLTQQVFFRLIQYRHSYKTGSGFRPWIYRIARNIFHDFLKQHGSGYKSIETLSEVAQEEENDEEPFILIRKALERIPDDYREVLMLSRYEELKYEEIATVLNISVSLVKVRVFRGLKALKEEYEKLN